MTTAWLLRPFALPYSAVTTLRNWLFDKGLLRQQEFPLPVISVGNLAVGGTGKTPHVEYIIRLINDRYPDLTPTVLSRGYGRRSKGFRWVYADSKADEAGDEPLQIKKKFGDRVNVAVSKNRCKGIERIMSEGLGDVIILDDAFQHRYVKPDLNILLTDYNRLFTRDNVLPAGRLRESRKGAARADIIVITKCPAALTADERERLRQEVKPRGRDIEVVFSEMNYANTTFTGSSALIVSGIARPEPLVAHLRNRFKEVEHLRFFDHHRFTKSDMRRIGERAEKHDVVVTTEKDEVRLEPLLPSLPKDVREKLRVQPIEVGFPDSKDKELFQNLVTSLIAKKGTPYIFKAKQKKT